MLGHLRQFSQNREWIVMASSAPVQLGGVTKDNQPRVVARVLWGGEQNKNIIRVFDQCDTGQALDSTHGVSRTT